MFKSPLHEIVERFSTNYWIHSCTSSQIDYALNYGATGIRIDAKIVKESVALDRNNYNKIINEILIVYPEATSEMIADFVYKYLITKASNKVSDIYHNSLGTKGRVSVLKPKIKYKNYQEMLEKIIEYKEVTSNIYVEIPSSSIGIEVIEEATYLGFSINAVDVYSVTQVQQIVCAVQRGLKRRESVGKDSTMIHPICTINNCNLKKQIKRIDPTVNPRINNKVCIHIIKKIYKELSIKGFIIDLNVSFDEYDDTWKEYIGDELTLSFTFDIIKKINDMNIKIDNFVNNNDFENISKNDDIDNFKILSQSDNTEEFDINEFFDEYIDEEYEKFIEMIRNIKEEVIDGKE